mmetsp:Transcript_52831/g.123178  ORF Transcript_52831/g.123178 Transcript_52831/m.123178 type:complete len:187 (+) Transcript_52831:71-631(+)
MLRSASRVAQLLPRARAFSGGPSAEAIAAIQANFKKNPAQALATFNSSSQLSEGLVSTGKLRDFNITADEPESFGGQNTAPNPVEILLFSLGSCQEITFKAFANAMGVPLTKVSVELTGHIDLRGFFAVDESVRAGFNKIEGTVTVDSPADTETIKQLKAVVDSHCPVKDMMQAVPMDITLNHIQK